MSYSQFGNNFIELTSYFRHSKYLVTVFFIFFLFTISIINGTSKYIILRIFTIKNIKIQKIFGTVLFLIFIINILLAFIFYKDIPTIAAKNIDGKDAAIIIAIYFSDIAFLFCYVLDKFILILNFVKRKS